MWRILQQDQADDYVLATGEMHSVREFVERAFALTDRDIEWSGSGTDEVGRDMRSGDILVRVDPDYYRPAEVDQLLGDATKARERLGWHHQTTFGELVSEMVTADLATVASKSNDAISVTNSVHAVLLVGRLSWRQGMSGGRRLAETSTEQTLSKGNNDMTSATPYKLAGETRMGRRSRRHGRLGFGQATARGRLQGRDSESGDRRS